jgi:excisionase family DNA binding protein
MHIALDSTPDRGSNIPFRDRVTCTAREACAASGLGNTTLYKLIGEGALETITVGRRRLIKVSSLLKLLGEQPRAA